MTTTTTSMTMRDFLTRVMAVEGMPEDLIEKAQAEIQKLDEKTAKRKTSEKALAKAADDKALRDTMITLLGTEPITSSEVAAKLTESGTEVSTSKVSAMFKVLVAEGKAAATEVKAKGGRKVKGFTLPVSE